MSRKCRMAGVKIYRPEIKCQRCGMVIPGASPWRKYCDSCGRELKREAKARKREADRVKAAAAEPVARNPKTPVRSLTWCVREANKLGISYGNFVAMGLDKEVPGK